MFFGIVFVTGFLGLYSLLKMFESPELSIYGVISIVIIIVCIVALSFRLLEPITENKVDQ